MRPNKTPNIQVELDVPARMRDGTVLRSNVYRPATGGPWPTLLTRTPYGKDDAFQKIWIDPIEATRRGFMVVTQDCRGRMTSDGEWSPLKFERQDGHDSVEWASRLSGSNGRVGMYGSSYCGGTQWMAARDKSPSLRALAPAFTWSDPLDGLFARGGAIELGLGLSWSLETAISHVLRSFELSDDRVSKLRMLLDDYDRLLLDGYWDLPVSAMQVRLRNPYPELGTFDFARNPVPTVVRDLCGAGSGASVPTFHVAGWFDAFLQGTLDNYVSVAERGLAARLVIGPWVHALPLSDPVGELCFGAQAAGFAGVSSDSPDLIARQLNWFSQQLRPEKLVESDGDEFPILMYVMGRNEWRRERNWPPASRPYRWYLSGGGMLRPGEPRCGDVSTSYIYDPANPVPTVGGHTVMVPGCPPGPRDQCEIENRPDVCVFTSEPLVEDLEVSGRVRMFLSAESSAPSTDWVARLCDVHPDGRSFNICDGIIRIDEGANRRRRYEIDLWSTSNVFLCGHRIRVHIASSSFPRWDRNLNTGDQQATQFTSALQSIFHDAEDPSYIDLPIVAS